MAKIAVDAVLLPSEAVADKAIEANRNLPRPSADRIVLSKEDCLPHISLAMGCIDTGQITEIEKTMQQVAGQFRPQELRIVAVRIGTNAVGEKVSAFEIERTQTLQRLHEEVMQRLSVYFSYDVTADMVLGAGVSESTLLWISNFPDKSSFEKFFPHITIGYGQLPDLSTPIEFTASQLALCRLGNHCTCRQVLISTPIQFVQ